jgi:hypothetical protein
VKKPMKQLFACVSEVRLILQVCLPLSVYRFEY